MNEDDADVLALLRRGDEQSFRVLVQQHHRSMVRVAATFVRSATVAEDVAQETWLVVFRGLGSFEERSSLRTWMYAILVNKAKAHASIESRHSTAASLATLDDGGRSPMASWQNDPHVRAESAALLVRITRAIETLPQHQRQVLVLRDVEGWTAADVAKRLGISDAHQRVQLHRARATLRTMLGNERVNPIAIRGNTDVA
jgi:RNA polymerase sigma-70 factor (ECF subfamily)